MTYNVLSQKTLGNVILTTYNVVLKFKCQHFSKNNDYFTKNNNYSCWNDNILSKNEGVLTLKDVKRR